MKKAAPGDVSALSAELVRRLADLGLKGPAQIGLARVLALLANPRLLTFPAEAILPQGVVLVNGIDRAVRLMLPQPDPDQVKVAEFGTVLRHLRDDMRVRLPAAAWPAVEAQSAALRAGLGPALEAVIVARVAGLSLSGLAAEAVTRGLCRCLTDLADLCLVTPLAAVPVAQAMVEVFEAGAMPCGYLDLEDPREVADRLCVWISPARSATAEGKFELELEGYIGMTAAAVMAALRPQFSDVEMEAVGSTVFLTSKAGGFFLASGPLGGAMQRYTVYLTAAEDYGPVRGQVAARIAGLETLADCAARFGPPRKAIPSIRLPGLPPTFPGQMHQQGAARISALSADGHRLDCISVVWLDRAMT